MNPGDSVLFALPALMTLSSVGGAANGSNHYDDRTEYHAPKATIAPLIDGVADDAAWAEADWQTIAYRWLGPEFSEEDFQGRFKVVWTEERIYILGEFVDDILFDAHRDPLQQYWDDDCWEIFIDEDHSGGEHQFNHNAFAYHLSLDNKAIDIGTDEQPQDYSHHAESRWQQQRDKLTWEASFEIYADDYVDGSDINEPIELFAGKVLGLMVAYNDNDGSELRENFIGSESIPSGPTDRGWIDTGLFGALVLRDTD